MPEQMNREAYVERIALHLARLSSAIRLSAMQSHYPSGIYDRIGCDLLNYIFDYHLTPANQSMIMRGVDLIDEAQSVSVQVTTTNTRQRVDTVLQIFSAGESGHRLCDQFRSLIILILTNESLPRYRIPADLGYSLQIFNLSSLFTYIERLPLKKLAEIHDYLHYSLESETNKLESLGSNLLPAGTTLSQYLNDFSASNDAPNQKRPTRPIALGPESTVSINDAFSSQAQQVLRFACLLPEEGFPWELFRQCLSEEQQQIFFTLVSSQYLIHRDELLMVPPAMRNTYLIQLRLTRENCADFLDRLLQYDRTRFWQRLHFLRRRDVLLQLAQTFGQAAKCLHDPDGTLSLRCAAFYAEINEVSNELQWCMRAAQACEAANIQNPWHIGNVYLRIADCYQRLGDHATSLKYCKKVLSLNKGSFIPADPDMARIYFQTGLAQIGLNHHTAALQSLNHAWNYCVNATAEDHPLRISISNMLSIANKATGNVDEAREYKLQSVRADSRSKILHTHSIELAQKLTQLKKVQGMPAIFRGSKEETLYFDIGLLYYAQGDYSRALEYHMQALKLREQRPGVTPKNLADSYHSIGVIFSDLNDQVEAMEYLQKAMELRESSDNIPAGDLIRSYLDLGAVYSDRSMNQYALDYFNKALSLQEKFLPPHSTELADTYTLMGNICRSLGQNREARDYYKMAVTVLEASRQAEQPAIAAAYMNLANAYIQLSQPQPALQYARRALHIYQKEFPKGHPLQITAQQTVSWLEDLTK